MAMVGLFWITEGCVTEGDPIGRRRDEPGDVAPARGQRLVLLREWTAASV
ncbi:hypothetical protein [Streptomyces sp. NPDC020571]